MQCSDNGEQQQRAGNDITREQEKEEKEKQQKHFLPCKTVDDVSAERPRKQRSNSISGQNDANDIFGCAKMFTQI